MNKKKTLLECHCKKIKIEIQSSDILSDFTRCDCSLCIKRGSIMAVVLLEELSILKGVESLSMYKFGKNQASHYFCSICGIYTHHRSFTSPNKYCINLGCIDDIDYFKFKKVPIFNGKGI